MNLKLIVRSIETLPILIRWSENYFFNWQHVTGEGSAFICSQLYGTLLVCFLGCCWAETNHAGLVKKQPWCLCTGAQPCPFRDMQPLGLLTTIVSTIVCPLFWLFCSLSHLSLHLVVCLLCNCPMQPFVTFYKWSVLFVGLPLSWYGPRLAVCSASLSQRFFLVLEPPPQKGQINGLPILTH